MMKVTRRAVAKLALATAASLSIARPSVANDDRACEFFVLGDWGQKGSIGQLRVAQAMVRIADARSPRFVISTGDNFYAHGVRSDLDPSWVTSFERVYGAESLKCPWYIVLGNHDYGGDVDAQITYARRHPRWVLPSRYYQRSEGIGGSNRADFFFLDTMPLVSTRPKLWTKWIEQADPDLQIDWLEQSLRTSSARCKIVVGHHPIVSAGPHEVSPQLVERVKPLLERYGVQAYFSGHEHNLQHHVDAGVSYFVCGAGASAAAPRRPDHGRFTAAKLGFIRAVATPSVLKVDFINEDSQVIHSSVTPLASRNMPNASQRR